MADDSKGETKGKGTRKAFVIKLRKEGKGDKVFYTVCGKLYLGEKTGTLFWNDRHEEYAIFPDEEREKPAAAAEE